MRMIFWVTCVSLSAIGGQCRGQAVIVEDKNVRFRTLSNGRFELTVCPTVTCGAYVPGDGGWVNAPFASFSYSEHSITSHVTSADFQYYELVSFGEPFSPRDPQVLMMAPKLGEVGESGFYLGIWIPSGDVLNPPPVQRYGWVHLAPVNGVITMVDNVMSYDSPGIVIGTTTVMPEPNSAFILTVSLAIVISRHRRPLTERDGSS